MSNIQKRLDALQPYVIGIRYLKSIPIVDVIFKEGWSVPVSDIFLKEKQEDEENYYMFYTQTDNLGIDELLDYVEKIINKNIERENKHELLKEKVKELQVLFGKTSLSKLKNMKFVLGGEELVPEIMTSEFDVEIDVPPYEEEVVNEQAVQQPQQSKQRVQEIEKPQGEVVYQPKSPEEMTDEVPEAELVGGITPNSDWDTASAQGQVVDLPPRRNALETAEKKPAPAVAQFDEPDIVCKCGPGQMCPVCM